MEGRPRFLPSAIAATITRAGDLWSTSLFMLQPGGEQGEMNPLTSVLGFSYWPLMTVNLAVLGAILYGHWHYCRHFGERDVPGVPHDAWAYQSLLFFGRPDAAWQLLFRAQRNSTLFHTQLAHVLVKVLTYAGLVATFHNCGQFYSWPINDALRDVLIRPTFVYYGLCLPLSFVAYRAMAVREFRWWRVHHTVPA
jgi:hypothetical protein